MPEPTYYFLHIPRTSGTSLTFFLEDQFRPEVIFLPRLLQDVAPAYYSTMENFRLVCGHFGWHWQELLQQPVRVITMLREPVERTLSHIAHICRDPILNPLLPASCRYKDLTLDDLQALHGVVDTCLNNELLRNILQNVQVRHLTGHHVPPGKLNRAVLDWEHWNNFNETGKPALEMVDEAVANLEKCWYFGFQKLHLHTLADIAHLAGWVPPGEEYKRMRISTKRPALEDLPRALVDRLAEINKADSLLYLKAKRLYIDRWSSDRGL